MEIRKISINEMVGYIVRRIGTNNIAADYIQDIKHYIADGYREAEVTTTLNKQSVILTLENHVAELPQDWHEMIMVIDCETGNRLPLMSSELDYPNQKDSLTMRSPIHTETSVFVPVEYPATPLDPKLEPLQGFKESFRSYYIQYPNIVCTNELGDLELTYWAFPIDEEGWPLLPDTMPLKEFIYWYVLKNLIGSGYQHKVFDYNYCFDQQNRRLGEALSSMRKFTPEHARKNMRSLRHIINPERYPRDGFGYAEQGWDG